MTTKNSALDLIPARTLFYHRERLRNRFFDCVLKALAERVRLGSATRTTIARRLGKDPAQVSRWLSGPSNWTIDTISDLMLALDADLTLDSCLYEQLPVRNYRHPMFGMVEMAATSTTDIVITKTTETPSASSGRDSRAVVKAQ